MIPLTHGCTCDLARDKRRGKRGKGGLDRGEKKEMEGGIQTWSSHPSLFQLEAAGTGKEGGKKGRGKGEGGRNRKTVADYAVAETLEHHFPMALENERTRGGGERHYNGEEGGEKGKSGNTVAEFRLCIFLMIFITIRGEKIERTEGEEKRDVLKKGRRKRKKSVSVESPSTLVRAHGWLFWEKGGKGGKKGGFSHGKKRREWERKSGFTPFRTEFFIETNV